jgi:hypothetical protein
VENEGKKSGRVEEGGIVNVKQKKTKKRNGTKYISGLNKTAEWRREGAKIATKLCKGKGVGSKK